jgi:hypothetical protein
MLDIVERSIPHAPSSGVEPVERIGEVVALIGLQSKTPASSGTTALPSIRRFRAEVFRQVGHIQ